MAEAVVALVTEGIKPLGELIVQQAKFLSGVGYQVKLAQIELHLMRGFLKDADTRQQDEELVRIWVGLIRDAAYDLEDVIETFALKVAIRRRGGAVMILLKRYACIFDEGIHRYKIGSEIEDIMAKLSHLRASLQSYNIRQVSGSEGLASSRQRQRDGRLTFAHEVESHLVGIKESTEKVVKELVTEGKRHLVVSIWGMGGSGKSTLAKQVFNHDQVKKHFEASAWVCISQQYDGRDVLEQILIKLTSPTEKEREDISKSRIDEIAEKVCIIQRERRCLVVLDDIWTREAWTSIKAGFPVHEETESRILFTTRKREVALLASGNDHLHQPRPLSEEQSMELFEKIAICESDHAESEVNAKKRELGKSMLVHCSGLPLAISVLAGVVSRRDTIGELEAVLGNVDEYIMRGKNVLENENMGEEHGVSSVLALSYDDLPPHLKLCFLYLAQFPEDHEIPVNRLTQLWIAEGFITSTPGIHGWVKMVEDVSYDCLIELVERSMVQVANYSSTGKVKSCRLHDLMRDLCQQKAKDENFLEKVYSSEGLVIGKARRRAIYLDRILEYEFSTDGRDDHIRSLLYFNPERFYPEWKIKRIIRSAFNEYKVLRVLKLENMVREFDIPKTIGNVVHLRFLSLKDSAFRGLPSSVSNLILLETLDLRARRLDIRSCFEFTWLRYTKIGNVFGNMEKLRHLYLPRWHHVSGDKLSFAKRCKLQTLVNPNIKTCDLNDLQHLRSLTLFNVGNEDIELRCPQLYKLRVLYGKMTKLPLKEAMGYPNLTKVKLIRTGLKGDQIEILEKLPKLRVLYLGYTSLESETLAFSQGGFPHLEFLTLFYLEDLKEWKVEKEAMPSLRRLCIQMCTGLRVIPDGVEDIKSLQELTIHRMPRRFCKRVEQGGDDFHKIKHVPSLIIINILPDEEDDEAEMEEAEIVAESTLDDETTEEIQASSSS